MTRALSEYSVKGIKTTIPFHARVMKNEKFIKGEIDTNFIDTQFQPQDDARIKPNEDIALVAAAIKAFLRDREKALRNMGASGGGTVSQWKSSGRIQRQSGV